MEREKGGVKNRGESKLEKIKYSFFSHLLLPSSREPKATFIIHIPLCPSLVFLPKCYLCPHLFFCILKRKDNTTYKLSLLLKNNWLYKVLQSKKLKWLKLCFFHLPCPRFPFLFSIFFYLAVLGLSCNMWDLVPWAGIEAGSPALGAQSLSHWTTREVPRFPFLKVVYVLRKFNLNILLKFPRDENILNILELALCTHFIFMEGSRNRWCSNFLKSDWFG